MRQLGNVGERGIVSARHESVHENADPDRSAMARFPGIFEWDNADTHIPIISRSRQRRRQVGVDRRLIAATGGSHRVRPVNTSSVNLPRARTVRLCLAAFPAERTMSSLSIVVVTYNSADTIAACIRSVPDDDEVVMVDQGSSDDTIAVARRARPNAVIVRAAANRGFGAGCNLGAANASGSTVVFLTLMPCSVIMRGAGSTRLWRDRAWGSWAR